MDEPIVVGESVVSPAPAGQRAEAGTRAAGPSLPAAPEAATPLKPPPDLSAPPRLRTADRYQLLSPLLIDDLLETNHPARSVVAFVEELDLSVLYDRIRARGGTAGRPAIDPRILVAVWLYATLAAVKSANALADLCIRHDTFFWLTGGLAINAHTLSDFRIQDADILEDILAHSVERLRQRGVIDLDRVAQDGVRVRASAGAASFRSRATLEKQLQEAQAQWQRLQQPADPPAGQGPAPSGPGRAAQRRHARERVERIRQALDRMPEMEAKKEKAQKKAGQEVKPKLEKTDGARVSTTDPEATVMKMADGGYRPAYNVQFSTACSGQVIVGVSVVTAGTDQGQLEPMLDQIEGRFGGRPREALVDGGYAGHESIESVQAGEKGCTVYAPVPKPRKEEIDRYAPKPTDSAGVAEWRERMGTTEAKEIYTQRGATAECVNAQARNRGLTQFLVRGLDKVKGVALWFAIAHNLARSFSLLSPPLLTT
jgi:transposase